jgi:hypothetical protein
MTGRSVALASEWTRSRTATLALLVALAACGGGGDSQPTAPSTPPPAKAVIKVLIDPSPVIAVATGDSSYPWDFRVNIQLSDSGGVAFIVTSMQTTVTSALSGGVLTTTAQNPFVGVKIPALGQETRQFHIGPYRMEFGTKAARVNFKLNFTDDRGNASVYDDSVSVQNVGGPVRLP